MTINKRKEITSKTKLTDRQARRPSRHVHRCWQMILGRQSQHQLCTPATSDDLSITAHQLCTPAMSHDLSITAHQLCTPAKSDDLSITAHQLCTPAMSDQPRQTTCQSQPTNYVHQPRQTTCTAMSTMCQKPTFYHVSIQLLTAFNTDSNALTKEHLYSPQVVAKKKKMH